MFFSCIFCMISIIFTLYIVGSVLKLMFYISTDKEINSEFEIFLWPLFIIVDIKNFIKYIVSSYNRRNEEKKKLKRDIIDSVLRNIV